MNLKHFREHSGSRLFNVAKPYSAADINKRVNAWRTAAGFTTPEKLVELMKSFQRRFNSIKRNAGCSSTPREQNRQGMRRLRWDYQTMMRWKANGIRLKAE
jgi:hypothetical protein